MVTQGRVVRFDEVRGYGFIRPRDGGEDVFMHANDLIDEKYLYQAGSEVEFALEQGEKGPKASAIRLVRHAAHDHHDHHDHRTNRAAPSFSEVPLRHGDVQDIDGEVELLSVEDFRIDLTEALLEHAGSLTVAQLKEVRACVVDLVRKRGWIVD
ncbi:cold-shock protein [Streptomyces gilvus]|uniref:cold-shock protein n=1 Tax=Streptomyces gilvus TaxID=2920937 RepID=UPI001F10923B|nr:cold shock domain-containing protein [Streptomyces sp. CME 23]MCH5677248.1 cold shock domain-containing protein [Streptomyces sp. CME 23]